MQGFGVALICSLPVRVQRHLASITFHSQNRAPLYTVSHAQLSIRLSFFFLVSHSIADELTENPFASTHALDANPFDDPSDPSPLHPDRLEELNRRERELQAREQELNKKAEHIRVNGRNNFPPCPPEPPFVYINRLIMARSLSSDFSFDSGRNSRGIAPTYHTDVPALAPPSWYTHYQPRRLHFHPHRRFE